MDYPRTVDEAVDRLIASLSRDDKATVKATVQDDLIRFHHGWGTGIRNMFGLWDANDDLLKSCADHGQEDRGRNIPQSENRARYMHPDDASMIIISAVWEALQSLEPVYDKDQFESACRLLAPDFGEISAELIRFLADHPDRMYDLDPRKFEELLEAVFRNQGYRTELGPGWRDGGIDLRLYQSDAVGDICTLVQAKRYRSDSPIRLEAVAALDSIVSLEGANRGLFVTTSRYLPSTANFAAKRGHRLTLATSVDVARWCADISRRAT